MTKKNSIPVGWEETRLDNYNILVIDGDRGKNYPKASEFYRSEHCLFLNAGNVTKKGFVFNENQFINKEKDSLLRKGKLKRKDIVITTRGTVGNIAYYDNCVHYENIRINSGMAIIRNENVGLDNKFLAYYLKSGIIVNNISRISFGSAQPQLTIDLLNKFKLIIPNNIKEQTGIAQVLSDFDEGIELLEEKIDLLKLRKKALMQQLLTGKKRLKGFSEPWREVKLGEICTVITGSTPSTKERYYYGKDYLFVSPGDIKGSKYIFNTEKKLSSQGFVISRKVPKGSVLFVCVGSTIGKIAIAGKELATNQQINSILSKTYLNEFLFYILSIKSKKIKLLACEQAVPIIIKSTFEKICLIIPISVKEQTAIAQIIINSDEEIELNQQKLNYYKDQKKYLLNNLITGKIRLPKFRKGG